MKLNKKVEVTTILYIPFILICCFIYYFYKLKLIKYGIYSFTLDLNIYNVLWSILYYTFIAILLIFLSKTRYDSHKFKKFYSMRNKKFIILKNRKISLISNSKCYISDKKVIKNYRKINNKNSLYIIIVYILIIFSTLNFEFNLTNFIAVILLTLILFNFSGVWYSKIVKDFLCMIKDDYIVGNFKKVSIIASYMFTIFISGIIIIGYFFVFDFNITKNRNFNYIIENGIMKVIIYETGNKIYVLDSEKDKSGKNLYIFKGKYKIVSNNNIEIYSKTFDNFEIKDIKE